MGSRHSTAAGPDTRSVVGWRADRLRAAGFAPELAARVAGDCGFDIHAVLDLVDRGCPPELAARIAAPVEERSGPC